MLIETKTNIPPIVSKQVNRTHLLNKLARAGDNRLIAVNGVAGSGKTSLICHWIHRQRLNAAWFSLDTADNDSDLFLRYLLTSFCDKDHHMKEKFWPLLQHEKELHISDVLPLLVKHLSKISKDFFLVLDDYHFISNQKIHEALAYMLNRVNKCFHIVLISRFSLPATLTQFKLKNQALLVSATEMRFTNEEAEQFLNDFIPGGLTPVQTKELIRITEGWVGGLQLFSVSERGKLTGSDFQNSILEMNHDAIDYLIEEVIDTLPTRVQEFIQSTALLERFNEELASDLLSEEDVSGIVKYISRNHLFLIPLDNENIWFRYHHLFADAVGEKVRSISPNKRKLVNQKAAIWFAEHGFTEDAFRNAFASRDLEFTADLMEDYLLDMPERHGYSAGLRWLSKLPSGLRKQRPLLRLHECGQKMESFKFREIKAVIDHYDANKALLYKCYTGKKKKLCRVLYINFRSKLKYYYQDPINADVTQLNKACQSIIKDSSLFAGYIKSFIIHHYLLKGDIYRAFNTLEEMGRLICQSDSVWAQIQWYSLAATAEELNGQLCRSEVVIQSALSFLNKRNLADSPLSSQFSIPTAWIHYYRHLLDDACECATKAVVFGERSQCVRDVIEGYLLLTLIYIGKSNIKKARHYLKTLQTLLAKIDAPDTSIPSEAWLIRLEFLLGDFQLCQHKLEFFNLSYGDEINYDSFLKGITKAELFYNKGQFSEAVSLLDILRQGCQKNGMTGATLETDLLRSIAHLKTEDPTNTKMELQNILARIEKSGYTSFVVRYASHIQPVLRNMPKSEVSKVSEKLRKMVFQACRTTSANNDVYEDSSDDSTKKLTRRENEILELIATGYKYKEIAQMSFISFETVKSHIYSIYRKLDVSSKMQAVKKAESLQILTSRQLS